MRCSETADVWTPPDSGGDIVRAVLKAKLSRSLRQSYHRTVQEAQKLVDDYQNSLLSPMEAQRQAKVVLAALAKEKRIRFDQSYGADLDAVVDAAIEGIMSRQQLDKGLRKMVKARLTAVLYLAAKAEGMKRSLQTLHAGHVSALFKAAHKSAEVKFRRAREEAATSGQPFDGSETWDRVFEAEFGRRARDFVVRQLRADWGRPKGDPSPGGMLPDGVGREIDDRIKRMPKPGLASFFRDELIGMILAWRMGVEKGELHNGRTLDAIDRELTVHLTKELKRIGSLWGGQMRDGDREKLIDALRGNVSEAVLRALEVCRSVPPEQEPDQRPEQGPQREEQSPWLLVEQDVTDWPGFCAKLYSEGNGDTLVPGQRIWELLESPTKQILKHAAESGSMQSQDRRAMLAALNAILERSSLYAPEYFTDVTIPQAVAKLLGSRLAALDRDAILRLNRLLMEASYPNRISRKVLNIAVHRFNFVIELCMEGGANRAQVAAYSLPSLQDLDRDFRGWRPVMEPKTFSVTGFATPAIREAAELMRERLEEKGGIVACVDDCQVKAWQQTAGTDCPQIQVSWYLRLRGGVFGPLWVAPASTAIKNASAGFANGVTLLYVRHMFER